MKPEQRQLHAIANMVNNTPLLKIIYQYRQRTRVLYAKSEQFNLTGSVKDRVAYQMICQGYASGALKQGGMIIEATSGNTGIAVCAIGRAMGHPVTIFMPEGVSRERVDIMRGFGARIELVSKSEGSFMCCIEKAEALAGATEYSFFTRQFSNPANPEAHYRTTGPEIWQQLGSQSLIPDAFVAGVGTGGTIMGTGRFLREVNEKIRLYPVEPASMPIFSTGKKEGSHRIEGIAGDFIAPIVDLAYLDEIIPVFDGDAILMAQKLARQLGLGVGISSGGNFAAAVIAQDKQGEDAVVATVFADDNKKYLTTDLMREEPIREGYVSPEVELLGYETIGRLIDRGSIPIS